MNNEQLIREIERREGYNKMAPFPVYNREIINDLKILNMVTAKMDSNNEPITYCKTCLSIHIKTVEFDKGPNGENRNVDYCVPCGNTDLESTHVLEWQDIYEEKYGNTFMSENKE